MTGDSGDIFAEAPKAKAKAKANKAPAEKKSKAKKKKKPAKKTISSDNIFGDDDDDIFA